VPYFSSIELTSSTPFIDFHFGKDPADYTARIIKRPMRCVTARWAVWIPHQDSRVVGWVGQQILTYRGIFTGTTVAAPGCPDLSAQPNSDE
jgi:hypothetical protein